MFARCRVGVLVLVFVCFLMAWAVAAGFGADQVKPGDTVVTCEDATPVMIGNQTVSELARGTQFQVTAVNGDWIGGAPAARGAQKRGWVKSSQIRLMARAARGRQTPPAASTPDAAAATSPRAKSPKLRLLVEFTPGSYTLCEVMNTTTEITAEGQRQKLGDVLTVSGGVTISAPDPSGEQTVRFVCRKIKDESSLPGVSMRFDSEGPAEEQNELLASVLRPLLGWEGVLTVRDGKFVKVEGVEDLMGRIQASLPPQAAPLADKLKTQMQEFLKELLTRHWAQLLPQQPVGPGDTWRAKLRVQSIPMLGEMTFDCDCALEGIEEAAGGKVAVMRFTCESVVEDRAIDMGGLVPPGVQARIQRMTVHQTGKARFDPRIGLSVQATLDSQLDGEMSVQTPDGQTGTVKLQVTVKYENTLTPDGTPDAVSPAASAPARTDYRSCVFDDLKLRKAPQSSAEETGKLRAGEEVQVIEVQASWCRVKTAQVEGWVHKMALAESAKLAQRIAALRPQPNSLFVLSQLTGPGSCACEIVHGGLKLAAPGQDLQMDAGNCLAIEKCAYRGEFSIFGKTIEPLRFDTLYWLNGQDELIPVLDAVGAAAPESSPPSVTATPAPSVPTAEGKRREEKAGTDEGQGALHMQHKNAATTPMDKKKSREANNQGMLALATGNHGGAVKRLEEAVTLDPENTAAWANLGAAYSEMGDFRKAVDVLSRALARNPDFEVGYVNLATAYARTGEYDQARKNYYEAGLRWLKRGGHIAFVERDAVGNLKQLLELEQKAGSSSKKTQELMDDLSNRLKSER